MASRRLAIVLLALLLGSSATAADRSCSNGHTTIHARFDAGNFRKCKFKSDDRVQLTIRREDQNVTVEQPWYAFFVSSKSRQTLTVRLRFPGAYARYWPKLSDDGEHWRRAKESAVTVSKSGREMDVRVAVDAGGLWVAAQELLTADYYRDWLAELDAHPDMRVATIGQSVEGRDIHLAKSDNTKEAVLLLGRQHPAEVPGAMAMRSFVDCVLADSELARRFRKRFTLLIVPLMNPDGVANGHWRHNSGRTDLNRDWGPFTQPETQSIARLLEGMRKLDMRPRLMLDFHATKQTDTMVFYTQTPADGTDPALFATHWLNAVAASIPDYAFQHDPRTPIDQANTKNYFFKRYGIPAITYEIADTIDRNELREHTPVFAEEMMRTLLASEPL